MTKDQAVALKDGDVIYVVDDTRGSMFSEMGAQNSPLVRTGLQRVVIGSTRFENWGPVHVFDVTGYLVNFAFQRNIAPEFFFSDVNEAVEFFETYARKLQEELRATISQLNERVREARSMAFERAGRP